MKNTKPIYYVPGCKHVNFSSKVELLKMGVSGYLLCLCIYCTVYGLDIFKASTSLRSYWVKTLYNVWNIWKLSETVPAASSTILCCLLYFNHNILTLIFSVLGMFICVQLSFILLNLVKSSTFIDCCAAKSAVYKRIN